MFFVSRHAISATDKKDTHQQKRSQIDSLFHSIPSHHTCTAMTCLRIVTTALAASTCLSASAFVPAGPSHPATFGGPKNGPLHIMSASATSDMPEDFEGGSGGSFEEDMLRTRAEGRASFHRGAPSVTAGTPPPPPVAYEGVEYDFQDVHSIPTHSEERQRRIEAEEEAMSRFAHGDELIQLRKDVESMRVDLLDARSTGDVARMNSLKVEITKAGAKDAEFIYELAMQRMQLAEREGLAQEAERFRQEALAARSVLPQFNLEGLWVGKYGPHGYEMINVTYTGDTLVAYKVTGDQNVPKGEVTFKADLSPEATEKAGLEPIELTSDASKQWGTSHLPRYPGEGQVAAEGFVNNQFVDGQLILVGEYFSFAWVPMGHQIFFGRPSPELTLKMLKESRMRELGSATEGMKDVAEMRAHAMRCLEETELLEEDYEVETSNNNRRDDEKFDNIIFEEDSFQ